ncbi:hypothetical protein, partial [Pectobacterium parmentieri]|uniref:hypothetical protein n=1 Tax=Pectobacterium parmentieri TaxID=1905730 RepID=UPI001E426A9E
RSLRLRAGHSQCSGVGAGRGNAFQRRPSGRQQRAQPCAPHRTTEPNPGGQPHAIAEEDRNAPITQPAQT